MKNQVKSTLVLVCICAVMAVLLAVTNSITAPIIKENQDAAANEALLQVMPGGEGFEKIEDLSDRELITLFVGESVSDRERVTVTEALEERFEDHVIEVYLGGQKIYDYLIAVE